MSWLVGNLKSVEDSFTSDKYENKHARIQPLTRQLVIKIKIFNITSEQDPEYYMMVLMIRKKTFKIYNLHVSPHDGALSKSN